VIYPLKIKGRQFRRIEECAARENMTVQIWIISHIAAGIDEHDHNEAMDREVPALVNMARKYGYTLTHTATEARK
jgi:hypothetical protein